MVAVYARRQIPIAPGLVRVNGLQAAITAFGLSISVNVATLKDLARRIRVHLQPQLKHRCSPPVAAMVTNPAMLLNPVAMPIIGFGLPPAMEDKRGRERDRLITPDAGERNPESSLH